ncbi:ADM_collapsed_G0057260.mRNA.1.CDS.1 [Saccharomyces cerevisiae]|nr:ADM_collapsed_G0057260.mRNA.1.CDS.1 [Saccharomyces cerevisiae]
MHTTIEESWRNKHSLLTNSNLINNNGTLTPNDSNDEKVTILVDSLTGNQLPTPTPTEMEPDLDTECFISIQITTTTPPVKAQWDQSPETKAGCKTETCTPNFSKVGTID